VPPTIIPGAGVSDLAVTLLPELGLFSSANKGKLGAGDNGDVGASDDLQEAQRVRDFLVAPLIAAHHGDAQDFHLRRLNQHEQGLHVAAAGARAVFVDDDFAAGLGKDEVRGDNQKQSSQQDVLFEHHSPYLKTELGRPAV